MNLNYRIAKFHKYSRQFTGLYIALSNLIAVALSGVSVAAGVMVYAFSSLHIDTSNPYSVATGIGVGALFVLIGIALSFLIEGLTISNCARLRKNVDNYRATCIAHSQIEDKTQAIKLKKEQQLKDIQIAAWSSGVFVGIMSMISILAATLFWHWILQSLPQWQAILYSTVFSAVVSITLIWSELTRKLNDQLVEESISMTSLIATAFTAVAEETTLEHLHIAQRDQLANAKDTDTFVDAATAMTDRLLDKTVSGGTGTFAAQLDKERKAREVYEDAAMKSLTSHVPMPDVQQPSMQLPAMRRDKARNLQQIRNIVADKGPDYVQQNIGEIADRLGVNISTMYRYLAELSQPA